MDRETLLLVAIVMLAVAACAVAVSGFVLLARDRKMRHSLAPAGNGRAAHPEVPEDR